jgi:hypothetical protein
MATASAVMAATQTAAAMRPGLTPTDRVVLSMPVLERSLHALTSE